MRLILALLSGLFLFPTGLLDKDNFIVYALLMLIPLAFGLIPILSMLSQIGSTPLRGSKPVKRKVK